MKNSLLIITLVLLAFSCKKVEGEGGTATIIGVVTTKNYNGAGELIATYPAADEDIFIVYGSNTEGYDDKTSTSYDGSFKFSYLTPGEYKVYIYSDCDTCVSGETAYLKSITISEKGEIVNAGEFINND
jgi:hypothetical protein